MKKETMKIGVVAPGGRLDPVLAERTKAIAAGLYGAHVDLQFHPQCFLSSGHFAGDDSTRLAAFVEVANDPSVDAVWFARGGYGACRIAQAAAAKCAPAARDKIYLGYSDAAALLSALYGRGFRQVAHGPMPADLVRDNAEVALMRALRFLVERSAECVEPSIGAGDKTAAFNIMILSSLLGTAIEPDLAGHVLMLEEVNEYMYRIDRALFHITSQDSIRQVRGIKLGRVSAIPRNEPEFGKTEEEVVRAWCERASIAYLGRADIGHDIDNKIVPFGAPWW